MSTMSKFGVIFVAMGFFMAPIGAGFHSFPMFAYGLGVLVVGIALVVSELPGPKA